MQFTVSYEAGIYSFEVRSTKPGVDYAEDFELVDRSEVRAATMELLKDIQKADEDFEEALGPDDDED